MTTWLSSWRRLVSVTGVCFVLFLALLAWRVGAGQDPGLAAAATATPAARTTDGATSTGGATDTATTGTGASSSTTTASVPTTQAS